MTRNEQQVVIGTVLCLAPGWEVVRQTAADDRLGRVAIEAMDAILGAMREEHEDAKLLTLVERAAQNYMAARWHIQKETGK